MSKGQKAEPLPIDDYYTLFNAFEEAQDAAVGGLGGKHAILVMVLSQLGYSVRTWEHAVRIATELLERGHA